MADEQQKRPWYRVRRAVGGLIVGAGAFFTVAGKITAMVPTQHVVIDVAGVPVTTQMIGVAASEVGAGLAFIGTNVFAWGLGKAQERKKKAA